jgi:hypothetical protein
MRAVELNPETKYKRLLVFFRLFFGRGESLETLQQLFLGHALDGDLGVVGIDARSGRTNQRDRIGLRLVHLEIVESAISRNETTGFLSLSRSTVSCEPDEIIRARCAAKRTRSNRLSTLSMQSSTVTRAIDCRSAGGV